MKPKKSFKLFKKRKDGSLGSLFCNVRARLPIGEWMEAKPYPNKDLAFRPFWHVMLKKHAPHLSEKGRVWCEVLVEDYETMQRPESQGGTWLLSKKLKIVKEML